MVWLAMAILSGLWAALVWVGYKLSVVTLQWLGMTPGWLGNFPELQTFLFWLTGFSQGLEGVVVVLTWSVWGMGQLALLLLMWLVLRLGAGNFVGVLSQKLTDFTRQPLSKP
jgi:hypothetical protein